MVAPRKTLFRILAAIIGAAIVLGGIFAVGRWLKDDVRHHPRYQFSIRDIDCEPPSGKTREEFLSEVHYYGQLPERLNALDDNIVARLTEAFGKHPRVEHVEQVTVSSPNRVRVEVRYTADNQTQPNEP